MSNHQMSQDDWDNYSRQLNEEDPTYWESRGHDEEEAEELARQARDDDDD